MVVQKNLWKDVTAAALVAEKRIHSADVDSEQRNHRYCRNEFPQRIQFAVELKMRHSKKEIAEVEQLKVAKVEIEAQHNVGVTALEDPEEVEMAVMVQMLKSVHCLHLVELHKLVEDHLECRSNHLLRF